MFFSLSFFSATAGERRPQPFTSKPACLKTEIKIDKEKLFCVYLLAERVDEIMPLKSSTKLMFATEIHCEFL